MVEQEEPKKSFKVVDRRRFHEDGTARDGPDVQQDRPRMDPTPPPSPPPAPAPSGLAPALTPAPAAAAAAPARAAPEAAASASAAEAPGALSFSMFMQSLAQQALMQLGLMPWPHGQRELHLEQARDTIDIVQLLKAKTKGNLTAEETQLVDTVVYELKMSWVEVQQAIARSKGAKMPPPPGAPR